MTRWQWRLSNWVVGPILSGGACIGGRGRWCWSMDRSSSGSSGSTRGRLWIGTGCFCCTKVLTRAPILSGGACSGGRGRWCWSMRRGGGGGGGSTRAHLHVSYSPTLNWLGGYVLADQHPHVHWCFLARPQYMRAIYLRAFTLVKAKLMFARRSLYWSSASPSSGAVVHMFWKHCSNLEWNSFRLHQSMGRTLDCFPADLVASM